MNEEATSSTMTAGASFVYITNPLPTTTTTTITVGSNQQTPLKLPTWRHFVAAAAASAITSGIYNPLDCLRVRWQMSAPGQTNIIEFGQSIVRQEGLMHGLWRRGITANMLGMGIAAGFRFGYYETLRDSFFVDEHNNNSKQGWHMICAGFIAGSTAYLFTTPLHLVKTKLQAGAIPQPMGTVGGILAISSRHGGGGGITGLWRGSLPLAVRGAFFTSGQMYGYDGFKSWAKSRGHMGDGPALHAVASVAAAFWASFLSAPADYVTARYMTSEKYYNLTECIQDVYLREGVVGFWKGWGLMFVRLTPVLFTYSTMYEQMRYSLGIGYLG